jgi:RNA polymerase subunit RPABC4/transcription elongation factor Spt4
MEQRIYHGNISPSDFARSLIAHFNRGSLRVQQIGQGPTIAVQIATNDRPASGGQTALSISLQEVEDGVSVQVGQQAWMGVAASLGLSALSVLQNPWNVLNRLDDIAQDIENLQLSDEVWNVIDATARALGVGHELSERLRRSACEYCGTANPVGTPNCISCGAPLGNIQPVTCRRCGYVVKSNEAVCPNCRQPL